MAIKNSFLALQFAFIYLKRIKVKYTSISISICTYTYSNLSISTLNFSIHVWQKVDFDSLLFWIIFTSIHPSINNIDITKKTNWKYNMIADDLLIKLWNWDRNWACQQVFESHTHYVMQIVINPKDTNTFASASLDTTVKVLWLFILFSNSSKFWNSSLLAPAFVCF